MGGINEVKLGAACGYHAAPILCAAKKKKTPLLGGLNEMKLGQHDKYHATPLLSIENPPVVGGNNPAQTRRCVDFTPPRFCRCWKESPPNDEGDKKSSNGVVCGMHTARSHLEGQTRQCVGCTLPHSHLEGQTRWCVGCTPPCWPLEQWCRREGAQMPSSPPMVSPFSLLPPLPSPSYSFFCPPRSLGLHDVAFKIGRAHV